MEIKSLNDAFLLTHEAGPRRRRRRQPAETSDAMVLKSRAGN